MDNRPEDIKEEKEQFVDILPKAEPAMENDNRIEIKERGGSRYAYKIKDERLAARMESIAQTVSVRPGIGFPVDIYILDRPLAMRIYAFFHEKDSVKRVPVVLQGFDFYNYSDKEIESMIVYEFFRNRGVNKTLWAFAFALFAITAVSFVMYAIVPILEMSAVNFLSDNPSIIRLFFFVPAGFMCFFPIWILIHYLCKIDEKAVKITKDPVSFISSLQRQSEEYGAKKDSKSIFRSLYKKRIARIKKKSGQNIFFR